MKEKKKKNSANLFVKAWLEIKKVTAWNLFIFLLIVMGAYLIVRHLIWRYVMGAPSDAICGNTTFRKLTSCYPGQLVQTKFYDLYSYLVIYVKYGILILKAFYFIMVPLGIYLILTKIMFKNPTKKIKIISFAVGVIIAILVYLTMPSFLMCELPPLPAAAPGTVPSF
jgi:multisubunit Na+/H+ antiporter MnhC subunit